MDAAIKLKQQGLNNPQIISRLEGQGYNSQQVAETINQLGIKSNIESGSMAQNEMQPSLLDEDIPVPTPPQSGMAFERHSYSPSARIEEQTAPYIASDSSDVQGLIESVVEEKWQRFSDSMTDFEVWKAGVNDDLISIKQEVIRQSNRFDILQKAVLGKVDEYNKSMIDVSSEIKALEKVFQNIISPLTSNIKELGRITNDLKGVR
ncbi:hypothetical protein J4409_01610 [Candidatus Woesearchaeota archaeon]|nr:hypothetical protein [Candidatus Woesearchaeota archaeon]